MSEEVESSLEGLVEQVRVRFEKLQKLRERNENPFRNGIVPTGFAKELHREFDEKSKEELETINHHCLVSGRIMAIRDFGKAAFVHVKDRTGKIQFFVQKSKLGEESYS